MPYTLAFFATGMLFETITTHADTPLNPLFYVEWTFKKQPRE